MTDEAAAYAHCEALLRADDPDAWLAALLAPSAARPHLHALGAFALEVGLVRTRVKQAIAGEIRLQWWQDVVDGGRAAEAAAHPVAAALADTIDPRRAAPRALRRHARRLSAWTSTTTPRPTCRRWSAGWPPPARSPSASPPARSAAAPRPTRRPTMPASRSGSPTCSTTCAAAQRPLLPVALLARHGATQGDVAAGRGVPGVTAAVADLRAAARARLAALRSKRKALGEAGPAVLARGAGGTAPQARRAGGRPVHAGSRAAAMAAAVAAVARRQGRRRTLGRAQGAAFTFSASTSPGVIPGLSGIQSVRPGVTLTGGTRSDRLGPGSFALRRSAGRRCRG